MTSEIKPVAWRYRNWYDVGLPERQPTQWYLTVNRPLHRDNREVQPLALHETVEALRAEAKQYHDAWLGFEGFVLKQRAEVARLREALTKIAGFMPCACDPDLVEHEGRYCVGCLARRALQEAEDVNDPRHAPDVSERRQEDEDE